MWIFLNFCEFFWFSNFLDDFLSHFSNSMSHFGHICDILGHIFVTFSLFFAQSLCHIFTIYGHIFVTFSLFLLKVMSHFHYISGHIYVTFSLFLTTVLSHFNYFGHISIWGKCAMSHWHLTGGPLNLIYWNILKFSNLLWLWLAYTHDLT